MATAAPSLGIFPAPIRLVRMERKVDGYGRPPPEMPTGQCTRPHPARPDGAQG
jgi:hypothetical protein